MLSDKKIMLIDDDDFTRAVLSRCLLGQGYTWIETISDSREAIVAIEHSRPDLILLDLMMPHVNGLEILTMMQDCGLLEKCAVLMLTAMDDEVARKTALSYGATDFIHKPITPIELANRVQKVLQMQVDRLAGNQSDTHASEVTGSETKRIAD